jgi:aminopeptidase N
MDKFRQQLLAVTCVLLLNSCDSLKNATTEKKLQLVQKQQIQDLPVPGKQLKKLDYQPSSTRINDILHTKLDVRFDYKKQYLYGKATITAKPYFYNTSTLTLDAREMEIKEVVLINTTSASQTPLQYDYKDNTLTIHLGREYNNNEEYTVLINYVAKPNELKQVGGSDAITDDKGLYFINPLGEEQDKPQQIWTQGETQSNSVWFPTVDRPNERMTHEIYMTVNKNLVTLSNGELAFSIDNGDSTRTDCWKMNQPHAPYLVMMAIGDFAVIKGKWRDKPVDYYVEKEYAPYAKAIFGNTPEMMEFYSNKLGVDFPWNKYAQIVVRDYVSGAMENTTAAIFGEFVQRNNRELLDKNYEHVVAHELFHEWFGDLVTCESWSNIPLNESFATYGEYLWNEYKYGRDVADYYSELSRNGYFAESENKQLPLIRYYYNNREEMFDAHSYNKGGQILHMLRKHVGDEAFFAALKKYLQDNKYSTVEIHNLRLAFEQVTGEDLNWFFNQWFFSSGHPDLLITNTYDAVAKKQKVQIKQLQDTLTTPTFKIPLMVDIYAEGIKKSHKITLTKINETFEFDVATAPNLVNVDAEKMMLCEKAEQKSNTEWAYQYKNAPLYLDRKEALNGLLNMPQDSITHSVIMQALNDKLWSIRTFAISELKKVAKGNEVVIKKTIVSLTVDDTVAAVREAAIRYLSANYTDKDLSDVYKFALNDSSYAVLSAAITAITKADSAQGVVLAKKYENEKNKDVLVTIAEVYARYGTIDNHEYFLKSLNKLKSYSKARFINTYGTYIKKISDKAELDKAITALKKIESDKTNKWAINSAKKVIEEIEARPTLQDKK